MGKIQPAEFDGPPPEKPPNAETDPHARMAYLARAKKYAQDKAANHSDRCSVNYKIEIARAVSPLLREVWEIDMLMVIDSSWTTCFICHITLISVDGRILCRRI